jgi:hypothetical protein
LDALLIEVADQRLRNLVRTKFLEGIKQKVRVLGKHLLLELVVVPELLVD